MKLQSKHSIKIFPKRLSLLIIFTTLFSLFHTNVSAITTNKTFNNDYAYSIIKEIADSKYKGRIAGTAEYKKAAEYIQGEFSKMDRVMPFTGNSFLQTYSTTFGFFKDTPAMSMDGKQQLVEETLGIDFNILIKRYYDWYNDKGMDYNAKQFKLDVFKPQRKINTVPAKVPLPVGPPTTEAAPAVIPAVSIDPNKLNVNTVTYIVLGDRIQLNVNYQNVPANSKICVFNPPDGDLFKKNDQISPGKGTYKCYMTKDIFDKLTNIMVNIMINDNSNFFPFTKYNMSEVKGETPAAK